MNGFFTRGSGRKAFLLLGLIVLAVGAGYLWQSRPAAPDANFVTLKGEKLTMQELRGKVVFINFWATSCATCIKEMPDVVETYERFADRDFDLLAVAMYYDPPNYVKAYTESNKLPFKVILDTGGAIASAFGGIMATPTALLIDKRGRIVQRFVGEPDFVKLRATIEEELASLD
jgi:peroxiredoxin